MFDRLRVESDTNRDISKPLSTSPGDGSNLNLILLTSPAAEADSSRRQPHLLSYWLWVWLVDGQDLCEKCRFQRASTQCSPAAHSPAGWSVCSVTAAKRAHGASSVQGNCEGEYWTYSNSLIKGVTDNVLPYSIAFRLMLILFEFQVCCTTYLLLTLARTH